MENVIGKAVLRMDAPSKVLGKAEYPADIEFPEMLYAGVVRSTIAYGKLKKVNMEKVRELSGIVSIIDYSMLPGADSCGVIFKDTPVLVKDIIKRVGDPIILIVAEDKNILKKAIKLVEIEYEEYEGIFTIEDALKEDAPMLGEDSNILCNIKIKKGDVDKGFEEAFVTAENWYQTQMVDHGFLQAEAAVARFDSQGNLELYVSTQYPHYDREEVARCLNMPEEKIKVINTVIGGAFGAREDITIQNHAALAAYFAKKPVKIVYSKEESTVTHCKRHPMKMYFKTGAKKDGSLCALKVRIWGDTGAYASWGINVLRKAAVHATGPYIIPNVDIESMAVYTNNSFSSAMRGFGATQVPIGSESQMDILAHKLNINPLKFRYMNSFEKNSVSATGQCLGDSVGIKECIREIAAIDGIDL